MSGIEEKPNVMPECKCGRLKTWIIRESRSMEKYRPIMCVNIDDELKELYGKWNIISKVKVGIVERAVDMHCEQCNTAATPDELSRVLALFKKECFG